MTNFALVMVLVAVLASGFLGGIVAVRAHSDALRTAATTVERLAETCATAMWALSNAAAPPPPPEDPSPTSLAAMEPVDPLSPAGLGLYAVDPTDNLWPTRANNSLIVPPGVPVEQFLGIGGDDGPIVANPIDFPGADLSGEAL